MNRRDFLSSTAAVSAALAFPLGQRKWRPLGRSTSAAGDWRSFEVTTRVEVLKPAGTTRVWVPAALVSETPYQKTLANTFDAPGGTATLIERAADALGIIAAEFPAGVPPIVTVTSRIATRNYAVDLSTARGAKSEHRATLEHFLRPTELLPTDGIVKATATAITAPPGRMWTRRAPSTSGSWTTRSAIPARAVAVSATSASCSKPATSAANAPISTRSTSVWPARRACRRATCTASGSRSRSSDTGASAPRQGT